jgi:hypothetical protein
MLPEVQRVPRWHPFRHEIQAIWRAEDASQDPSIRRGRSGNYAIWLVAFAVNVT